MSEPSPSSSRGNANASARQSVVIAALALAAISVLFGLGLMGWLPSIAEIERWLAPLKESPWGLPATILVFCTACYLAVPQTALILLTVAVFGPVVGAGYAFIANLCSGVLTFWVGRWAGHAAVEKHAGPRVQRISRFIGRNALMASTIVRLVPTGPYVFVNTVFAVSGARFAPYFIGLGLGIIPKIALLAFAGQSLFAAMRGNPWLAVGAGLAALVVLYGLNRLSARLMANEAQDIAAEPPRTD